MAGTEIHMSKPDEHPSGQPISGQWAEQQKQGMAKQEKASNAQGTHRQLTDEEQRKLEQDVAQETTQQSADTPGDAGGAGNPRASRLEPEKQGGIGGP
jgi:hypothetical protein